MGLIEKIFGSYSKRELKRIKPILQSVLDLEEEYKAMPEEKLRGQTAYLRGMLSDGETLDTILPRAFAVCREATRRVLGTPHYPVQIIGGIVLHQGRIAEMRTGEGKTQTCLEIYKLDVVEIPTNKPVIRVDHEDVVFKNERGKYNAVIEQIAECHKKGQPVLVGTVTIDKSEHLSSMLKRRGIQHVVLNAKYHDREAEIVAQAGKKGAVTIATNMAGRGTDIKLGGNDEYLAKNDMRKMGFTEELIAEADAFGDTSDEEILNARRTFQELVKKYKPIIAAEAEEVRKAGGLFILGTERHESRRIDNQLRGRSGRQGDPGESRFFLSLEDDIMRLFGGNPCRRCGSRRYRSYPSRGAGSGGRRGNGRQLCGGRIRPDR